MGRSLTIEESGGRILSLVIDDRRLVLAAKVKDRQTAARVAVRKGMVMRNRPSMILENRELLPTWHC